MHFCVGFVAGGADPLHGDLLKPISNAWLRSCRSSVRSLFAPADVKLRTVWNRDPVSIAASTLRAVTLSVTVTCSDMRMSSAATLSLKPATQPVWLEGMWRSHGHP